MLIRTGVEPRHDQSFDSAQRPLKGRQDDTTRLYAEIRMTQTFLCDPLRSLRLCVKTGLEMLYLFFSLVP